MKFLKINLFIIISFLILILIKTSTPINLVNLIKYDYDERWNNAYGFCKNEALGFVKDMAKKYKFDVNPKIINFKKYPDPSWVLYAHEQIQSDDKLILLNYIPKKKYVLKKLDYNKYISTDSIFSVSNISEIQIDKKPGHLAGSIKIFKSDAHKDIFIDIVSFDGNEDKIILKNFTNMQLNNPLDPINRERKYIFQINSNDSVKLEIIKNINVTFNTLYDLKNYNIIEKYQNCYFVEK